jgi:hypothetical protein
MVRLAKREIKSSLLLSLELPSSSDVVYLGVSLECTFFLLPLSHETLVANVWEEEAFVDGDVGGVLIEGGEVGGALVGVPFLPHVRIATLLLVVPFLLHFLLPLLVFVPDTFTCIWTLQ